MTDLDIHVSLNGQYVHWAANVKIGDPYSQCFKPLKTCRDAKLAHVTGEQTTESAIPVFQERAGVAKEIAEHLTALLLECMQKQDTINGYPVEKAITFKSQLLQRPAKERDVT